MENLDEALNLTVVGIVIVFAVLSIIAAAISIIGRIDRGWRARESQEAEEALAAAPTIDATTLVLISAAVATYCTGRYRIRKIRRMAPSERSTVWSSVGRAVLMGSHVVPREKNKS